MHACACACACGVVCGWARPQIADELLRSKEFRDKHKSELPVEFEQASVWLAKMGNFLIAKEDVHYLYMKLLGREPDERA
jgi:hypothetical protein